MGNDATARHVAKPGADLIYEADQLDSYRISAENAMTLTSAERERKLGGAIVYGRYAGSGPKEGVYFADDLALIQLSSSLPAEAVEPARIATDGQFEAASTIAGYGYSNADGGTVGRFNLTWPRLLKRDGAQFTFVPGQTIAEQSAFCQGDSGGPVLAGRNRGCKRTDSVHEFRPRYLQAVISYNKLVEPGEGSSEMQWSIACMTAEAMAMQDVVGGDRRAWICERSNREAGGC
jgi:hypothetical protein